MKKIISSLLVLIILGTMLAFTACGDGTQKLVCGVTIFEPMNYKDADGNWTGFDTELAQMVGEKLGMEVEFQQIDWSAKYSELEAGTINCIWNGFTADSSEDDGKKRSEYVDFSYSYMINQQCVVIKSDNIDTLKTKEDLKDKKVAAESGSAGESTAKGIIGEGNEGNYIAAPAQINTFAEVKSGAVDFAVVDVLLAEKLTGTGDYNDLVIADIDLGAEHYAIGFKKGSELTAKVNQALVELNDEGKIAELAEKYNLENTFKLDTEFVA